MEVELKGSARAIGDSCEKIIDLYKDYTKTISRGIKDLNVKGKVFNY